MMVVWVCCDEVEEKGAGFASLLAGEVWSEICQVWEGAVRVLGNPVNCCWDEG